MDAHASGATASTRGHLLDGRYRLDTALSDRTTTAGRVTDWRAVDVTLDRRVAVTVLVADEPDRADALIDAATRAGTVTDSRFVRVLDAGTADVDIPAAWVATEWVDGRTLAATVGSGEPLPPPAATHVVRQCADAMAAAAAAGVTHGALTPDRVLLPRGGVPRITGLGTSDVLGEADERVDDVRALGALLYAGLTGRWPLPGWPGLPGVDRRALADPRPRVVRAGIPRDLDEIVRRALVGEYADARQLARALGALPSAPLDAPAAPPAPARSDAVRRWLWRIVPPVVVVAVGITGWTIGSDLGRVPLTARQHHAALPPTKGVGANKARVRLVWHHPPAIRSFDPAGDGEENPDAAGLAVDSDPTTEWTSDTYRGDPHLGGLKPGVGLLVDLGRPRRVAVAELALSAAGADVEVHAGDTPPAQAGDLPVVASRHNAADRVHLELTRPVRARYWLVWFTSLPPASGGYRIGVAEIALLG